MSKLKHKCNECDSTFTITYQESECPDDPTYCPFCASYILEEEDDSSEYDEDED